MLTFRLMQDLVALLVVFFPSMNSQSVVVQTNELDICAGRYVDIPQDLWPEISPQIHNIRVVPRTFLLSLSITIDTKLKYFQAQFKSQPRHLLHHMVGGACREGGG